MIDSVAKAAKAVDEAVVLPLGISLSESDGIVTVVNAARDSGDAFSLFFLGCIAAAFAAAIGQTLGGGKGVVAALVLGSPAWGFLMFGALKRAVNSTKVIAKRGVLEIVRGPVGKQVQRLEVKDISSIVSRMSEHRSSTRGGKLTIQRTHSVYVVQTNGKDALLVESLETDAQARFVEKALWRVLRS
jgi:hypothetical protein